MLGLNQRKLQKLKTNPKLFFKDAIEKKVFQLSNVYSKYLPKKHKGFTQYTIISAVYNVEKYLDDYFNSIINQRLDFKKNIFMILVDDGSNDNSANIIKKYQKKYPKNIVYLYKENGGQASARNLGLRYMQENNYKTPWVTFTDPDDFLDRNYFYEVDKFLSTHQDDDICMIGTNNQMFFEENSFIQNHPLYKFKFENGTKIVSVDQLKMEIQTSTVSLFKAKIIENFKIYFDERINVYEDIKFLLSYISNLFKKNKVAFLVDARYYSRKRVNMDSTMNKSYLDERFYLDTLYYGIYDSFSFNDTLFSKNCALSLLLYQIRYIVNNSNRIGFMSIEKQKKYLLILDNIFSKITQDDYLSFNAIGNTLFYKVGILNCFKKEKPPFQITYIEDYDPYKEQILITYYTGDDKDIESIVVDGEEVYADYEKIVKYDFLGRVFCYQKRLWISIPKNAEGKLEIFINNKQAMIGWQIYTVDIKNIRKEFQKRLPKSNIWLFADRDIEADDNAEHLYRYIMQNHPEQEIVFALRKESSDWERLEKEGFNLVDFGSYEFERIIKRIALFISSHTPGSFGIQLVPGQKFIFLGHGVDAVNISNYFNKLKINLRLSSCSREYQSLVEDYNQYELSTKEVIITGQPRHDALSKGNKLNTKRILIMPTWRLYLVEDKSNTFDRNLKDMFFESEYYKKWFSFLNNSYLKKLINCYGYKIVFVPHFNMKDILNKCNFPDFINVHYRKDNESFQKNFQNCDLMITDYTSAAFEMAYLEKPVVYYQFDQEYFFNNHSYKKGWFDYEIDGFGPVVKNEDDLLRELENLLKSDCVLNEIKYTNNIKNTFKFKDQNNCIRVYNEICKLSYMDKCHSLKYLAKKAFEAQNNFYYELALKRWKFILNSFQDVPMEFYGNFLYCLRRNSNDEQNIMQGLIFIEKLIKNIRNVKMKTIQIELLKNYAIVKKYDKVLKILDLFKYDQKNMRKLTYLKLQISVISNDIVGFERNYSSLLQEYKIPESTIKNRLYIFQTTLNFNPCLLKKEIFQFIEEAIYEKQ
ncbi:glycosyltransferase [Campylobacter coli]|nr:glycosyltransferase [Campylobacter coli]EAK3390718.1 glycosyltransferase [Campylobacter coli]